MELCIQIKKLQVERAIIFLNQNLSKIVKLIEDSFIKVIQCKVINLDVIY